MYKCLDLCNFHMKALVMKPDVLGQLRTLFKKIIGGISCARKKIKYFLPLEEAE